MTDPSLDLFVRLAQFQAGVRLFNNSYTDPSSSTKKSIRPQDAFAN